MSVTQQLVDDVIAAGGSLVVPQRSYWEKGVDYEKRVQEAHRHGKVPAGKRLVITRLPATEMRIDLVDAPEGTDVELSPVPVPERVGRYHAAARAFRDHADEHRISRAALPRAVRILQGLVVEAEARGFTVTSEKDQNDRYGRNRGTGRGRTVLSMDGYSVTVDVAEEGMQSWWYWQQQNSVGYRSPSRAASRSSYEANATGRLTIELDGYSRSGRQVRWSDRKRWTVEDKLPELLREVQVRVAEHRHRLAEQAAEAEARHRAWEAAVETAKVRYSQQRRADTLMDAVTAWQRAEAIREYCDAMERTGTEIEWLKCARTYADQLSPPDSPPNIPDSFAPANPEELRPYLDGWSPHPPTTRL